MIKTFFLMLMAVAVPRPAVTQPMSPPDPNTNVLSPSRGSVPVPDPTELTRLQLEGAIKSLRELMETRLNANEQADAMRLQRLEKVPEDVREQVNNLKVLVEQKFEGIQTQFLEKFAGIQKQFEERDTRVAQTSVDSKLAIDAALQAAKEAVGKSELGTKDVIQQQGDLLRTVTAALGANLDDLKQRTTAIESKTLGIGEAKGNFTDNTGMMVGIAGLALALVVFMTSRRPSEPQIRYVHTQQPLPTMQPAPGVTTTTNTSAA